MTGRGTDLATVRDRLSVEVTGLAGGSGELTWGQRFVWDILQSLPPDTHYLNIRFRVHLPSNATRDRVLAALATLLRRHDALRTRFVVEAPDGRPRQQCDPAGQLPVEYCETEPGQVRRLAEQDEEQLWQKPFRNDRDWPMRVSIVAAGGRPRQIVFVFSHLAVDAWACALLRQEFLDLLRHHDATPEVAGWRPRDRAAFEHSQAGRRVNELSLTYWRRMLETMPQTAFPIQPAAGETPRFPGVGLHSVALAAAAQAVAARQRVGPAAVLLAVLSAIIGIRTDTEQVPLMLATRNRFTPVDTASVGTFYHVAPALIRLHTRSLAGTIRNASQASMIAHRRGQCDPWEVARLLERVRAERGVDLDLSTTMNVVPEPGATQPLPVTQDVAALRELTATTRVSDLAGRDTEQLKLYAHIKSLRSRATLELFCDSRYLAASDARKLLAGLELVLIEMLQAGDVSLDRVADLVGIAASPRPPGCAVVDNCWTDVDAVSRLLGELPETTAARAFVVHPDTGPPRLVGYVTASCPTTPERLHTALVSRLGEHLTRAPQWYVICGSAPTRLDSRSEWEQQVVLYQGSGRAGQELTGPDATPAAHLGG